MEHFDGARLSPNSVRNAVWHALIETIGQYLRTRNPRFSTVYTDNSLGPLARDILYNAAHALCVLDNWGYRRTVTICNTYCFSTATVVTRTRLNVTLCVHIVCFVLYRYRQLEKPLEVKVEIYCGDSWLQGGKPCLHCDQSAFCVTRVYPFSLPPILSCTYYITGQSDTSAGLGGNQDVLSSSAARDRNAAS